MTQENPQNPIQKAHLEGKKKLLEEVSMALTNDPYKLSTYEYNYIWDAIDIFAESILNAALEVGKKIDEQQVTDLLHKFHKGMLYEAKIQTDPIMRRAIKRRFAEVITDYCLSSYISAIDEGIKEIKKGDL